MEDFQEVLPEEAEQGTRIPAQPIQPPEIAVPAPQPAPEVAELVDLAPPARVNDLDRLGLHHTIVDALKSANIITVADVSFFARANNGQTLLDIPGIAAKRLDKIIEALEALETA